MFYFCGADNPTTPWYVRNGSARCLHSAGSLWPLRHALLTRLVVFARHCIAVYMTAEHSASWHVLPQTLSMRQHACTAFPSFATSLHAYARHKIVLYAMSMHNMDYCMFLCLSVSQNVQQCLASSSLAAPARPLQASCAFCVAVCRRLHYGNCSREVH